MTLNRREMGKCDHREENKWGEVNKRNGTKEGEDVIREKKNRGVMRVRRI